MAGTIPEQLPFLEAISWYDNSPRELSELQMLRRYEDGWRYIGVMADPSEAELRLIRSLVRKHGSILRV